jgi:hypothetical protein
MPGNDCENIIGTAQLFVSIHHNHNHHVAKIRSLTCLATVVHLKLTQMTHFCGASAGWMNMLILGPPAGNHSSPALTEEEQYTPLSFGVFGERD